MTPRILANGSCMILNVVLPSDQTGKDVGREVRARIPTFHESGPVVAYDDFSSLGIHLLESIFLLAINC